MKTNVNGTELHYEISGKPGAPWLVFSHSLACSLRMWDPQVAAFGDRYRILNYDLRGHGQSGAPDGPYTLDALADDVLALMDELHIDRCVYVGLSIGGMIGQTLALRQTGRFDKMVFADTGHTQSPEGIAQWDERIRVARIHGVGMLAPSTIERWFTPTFRDSAPAMQIAATIAATPIAGYVGCVEAIKRLNTTARLGEIRIPVLAIAGEADGSLESTKYIAAHIPGARFVSVPHAAHIANVEQPAAFTQALRDFF